jgi:hypothetical protein
MHTDKKDKRRGAEAAKIRGGFFSLRFAAISAPLRFAPSVFIRVHPWLLALFVIGFAFPAVCADADYKLVLVTTTTNGVRVRLPLTDVTGKVRVKEISPDGFGIASQQHNEDIRQILETILRQNLQN